MFNALSFDDDIDEKTDFGIITRVFYAGDKEFRSERIESFKVVSESFEGEIEGNVYLESLSSGDKLLDKVIEQYLQGKGKLIVNLANSLYEVGSFDKRYGCSPVFYAEKLGLLDGAYLTGCVYLDKDDVELINLHEAQIILTPSSTMGKGFGIPPVRMMATLGARVHLGTGLKEYNPDADLLFEKKLISLAASGSLCTENALSEEMLNKMLS